MSSRPRERILANLEAIYRDAYERAKTLDDQGRMADLDAAYQREQLLLEVLLDIRDTLGALSLPSGGARADAPPGHDAITALESIRRITKLR
jgi:hypothetical protein